MSTITYENLQVAGIPYEKILDLSISHEPNAHGCARIKGLIPYEKAERIRKAGGRDVCGGDYDNGRRTAVTAFLRGDSQHPYDAAAGICCCGGYSANDE